MATCNLQMSLAFAGALTSKAALSRLSPQLLPRVSPLSLAVPDPRTMMQKTLQRNPIAMATAVGAAYTAGRAPLVSASHSAFSLHVIPACFASTEHTLQDFTGLPQGAVEAKECNRAMMAGPDSWLGKPDVCMQYALVREGQAGADGLFLLLLPTTKTCSKQVSSQSSCAWLVSTMFMLAQVQEVGSRMGDGLCGMAMSAFASTALVGQSAVRGLACGAQEVRP